MADGAAQSGLDQTAVFHIELACDEACTNVIEHAYSGEDKGEITVSWQMRGGSFIMHIHDNGRSFNPETVPVPTLPPDASEPENVKVGGLGLHFMRQLMDDVRFEFNDKLGNTLTLIKKKK